MVSEPSTSPSSSDNDDDDNDSALLMAAAQWAAGNSTNQKNFEDGTVASERSTKNARSGKPSPKNKKTTIATTNKKKSHTSHELHAKTIQNNHNNNNNVKNTNYSLHITQLSYDTTESELRKLFLDRGCIISSLRMVYDYNRNSKTGRSEKAFRGVAFIDLRNIDSYNTALKLNKNMFMGRKINVRPTKTHKELADIVQKREEKLSLLRSGNKNKSHGPQDISANSQVDKSTKEETKNKSNTGKNPKRKERPNDDDEISEEEDKKKKTKKQKKLKQPTTNLGKDKDGETSSSKNSNKDKGKNKKPSKKERNRRAAILLSKKRRTKS